MTTPWTNSAWVNAAKERQLVRWRPRGENAEVLARLISVRPHGLSGVRIELVRTGQIIGTRLDQIELVQPVVA